MAEKIAEAVEALKPKPKPKASGNKKAMLDMAEYAKAELIQIVESISGEEDENKRVSQFMKHCDRIIEYKEKYEKFKAVADIL